MRLSITLCFLAISIAWAAPATNIESLNERQTTGRLVFCHFMVSTIQKIYYQKLKFSRLELSETVLAPLTTTMICKEPNPLELMPLH
jgi:hypothetical protein